ncbi:MAG: 2-hydroxyhepta-2,4-diene-1,7-dioate isomerase [Bacteroides sp. SM23_62_1]|nr:MAG: 2-hydroxyhepta-2,4-diene-1,7-dioate isomerase [Bacteroides sp. SM23_62_1]
MRLFKTKKGIIIEKDTILYLLKNENWDRFVNDDYLHNKMLQAAATASPVNISLDNAESGLLAPVQSQELWASGVTYYRSKVGRQEESKTGGGGGDFYAHVYEAERPELFYKASLHRIVGPYGKVRIRKDSTWDVPEPELTLMITSGGKIVGYTVGNDMSSRSIEGENPLYLPQAKTYDGCAAIGPCIYVHDKPLPDRTVIEMNIYRKGEMVFEGKTEIGQMKREPEELVSFLYRECSFPHGSLLMTGTGIVPPNNFTLQSGDKIAITIEPIGTLINFVA